MEDLLMRRPRGKDSQHQLDLLLGIHVNRRAGIRWIGRAARSKLNLSSLPLQIPQRRREGIRTHSGGKNVKQVAIDVAEHIIKIVDMGSVST